MTLFSQFNSDGVFSLAVPPGDYVAEEVMIAKLMLLFPDWTGAPVDGITCVARTLREIFANARNLKPLFQIAPLEQQLREMEIRGEWRDFLRLVLNPDPEKRPSASAILQSSEYLAIRKATHLIA